MPSWNELLQEIEAQTDDGHRIDRDEARAQGVIVEDLEDNQALQEAVLTAYHMATIAFEKSPAAKILAAHTGRMWIKNAG